MRGRDHKDVRQFGQRRATAHGSFEKHVLHKCANPECEHPFRRLTEGKLFLVDRRPANAEDAEGRWQGQSRVEYYWLCDQCTPYFTLTDEPGRGILAVPVDNPSKRPAVEEIEPRRKHSEKDQYVKRA
jgi:hypothetical protein